MSFKNAEIVKNNIEVKTKKTKKGEEEWEERVVVIKALGIKVELTEDPDNFPLEDIGLHTQYDITITKSKEVQKKIENYINEEEKEDE